MGDELYTPLSTDHDRLHSRVLEEFPEGPYGTPLFSDQLGKSSGWDTGEHAEQPFGYEADNLHRGLPRLDPAADPIHYENGEEETPANFEKQ